MTWVFRVWRFFSPNSTLFALLSGGFMGLSVTSTRIYGIDPDVLFSAFFPGRAKVPS
jgi:hypothetical protein